MTRLILSILMLVFAQFAGAEPKTVSYVDLNRYLGRWYEIATIPQFFEQDCFCSQADYSSHPSGGIRVVNTCLRGSVDGNLSRAEGLAEVVDPATNAKFKVTFFWPFSGDYWIIGLDSDYRYSVVTNQQGSSLWILSRTPELEESLLREALATVEMNGIDVRAMRYTVQAGCTER